VDKEERFRIQNREILLLVALSMCAIGVFAFTRSMARKEQQLEARIAAIWYSEGEHELAAGEIEKAIESLRTATANARDNRTYALALANALAAGNHTAEAQQALLRLRESDPENAEINLYLARLAAKRSDIHEALHYYQNALYGRWTGTQVDDRRRQLRIELIRFLLDHQERNRALSELLLLESDLPRSALYRVEIAKFFVQAGDAPNALKNFVEAIRLDAHNVDALIGAADIEFQSGNYLTAQRFLKSALYSDPKSERAQELLSLTRMVLDDDPLASHIPKEEQRKRLLFDLLQSRQRLESCLSRTSDAKKNADLQELEAQALAAQNELRSNRRALDLDSVSSDVALIYEIEKTASANCGTPAGVDQALLLIGLKHGGA
jgi:predicted Zn-dependent protease